MLHMRSYNAKIHMLNEIQVKIYASDISYMLQHFKTVRCAIKKVNQSLYRPITGP